ncbi:hypothetical protein LMG27198_40220 [Methylocystis echinoides]|uniref:Uncharacterized protein n=1 Tax=Methylocystis echinoides TaxID=29468 RepID=A0A9W6LTS5_9HYPH|nr:hypothetical protein LMG27198_40220 [Methylocystis echinoides]
MDKGLADFLIILRSEALEAHKELHFPEQGAEKAQEILEIIAEQVREKLAGYGYGVEPAPKGQISS